MKRLGVIAAVVLAAFVGIAVYNRADDGAGNSPGAQGGAGGRGAGGATSRPPMTVELASVSRTDLTERITIVGNLIGAATVEVVPKVGGRLQSISVRLGDPVRRGQTIAQVEDQEIREQVKQAEASFEVAAAGVRQREADLKFAESNLERSRNLFSRQLLPRQALDDADARYQAAVAQVDLARAQHNQAKSRSEELRLNLANTVISSPVDGFVGRRQVDPGAFVGPSQPVVSVVDIHLVRLVANVVEKELKRMSAGLPAEVEVDAYPGEVFKGRIARIAPVLDPSTRTAEMEIEVPNADFRLKPGMYARVRFVVDRRPGALVVPRNAVVDIEGQRGVFLAQPDNSVKFRPVTTGLEEPNLVEVREGLRDTDRVVATGASALRDGDRVVLASGQRRGSGSGAGQGRGAAAGSPEATRGGGPPTSSATR